MSADISTPHSPARVSHTIREGYLAAFVPVGPAVEAARVSEGKGAPPPHVKANHANYAQGRALGGDAAEPPEVVFRHDGSAAALEGSTISDPNLRVAASSGVQRNRCLLRLRLHPRAAGEQTLVLEVRALLFVNDREIIRYTVYRDTSAGPDFVAGGPGAVEVTVREAQVRGQQPDRAAEVALSMRGWVSYRERRCEFRCLVLVDASARLHPVEPQLQGAPARWSAQDGTVEIELT